jgi:ABC-type bacteriocin/lantibiotic exporter with double-glycine peptidase domain
MEQPITTPISPIARIWSIVREEKADVTAVYFYAILGGIIQLALPLCIQSILGFVLGAHVCISCVLITFLIISVFLTGVMQVTR